MPARIWTAGQAAAALLLVALISRAGAQSNIPYVEKPAPEKKLVQRVYHVADLVVPIDQYATLVSAKSTSQTKAEWELVPSSTKPTEATLEASLIKLITHTVAPQSWDHLGGAGTIDYYPLGMALVVYQSAEVQEQIADLLASLRRLQDVQVAVEFRFVSVSSRLYERLNKEFGFEKPAASPAVAVERIGIDSEAPCQARHAYPPTRTTFLNDAQVFRLMALAQGDRGTNVLAAPCLTTMNAQEARIEIGEEQHFVTGVDVRWNGQQVMALPRQEACPTGLKVAVKPFVSADRRFVSLSLKANLTGLESAHVPLAPVMTTISPAFADGGTGQPVPFTQFIQTPRFQTLTLDRTVCVPAGSTAVVSGFARPRQVVDELPIWYDIPVVRQLLGVTERPIENEHVLLMVTPRVHVQPEVEEISPPCVCPTLVQKERATTAGAAEEQEITAPAKATKEKRVAKLLEKYHQACADGRPDKAKKLAERALALDPRCFAKPAEKREPAKPPVGTSPVHIEERSFRPILPAPRMPERVQGGIP